jgi:fatty-acyl-CoA synthase
VNYEDLGEYDLSSLEQLLIVGSPLSEKLATAAEEKIGCKVVEGYGLTETSMLTAASLKEHLGGLTGEERRRKVVSAGFATLFSEIRVVNEKGEDVKPDGKEVGEVIGRSNAIADGYWKLPEETKRTWVNGWFHSGDMATIDEDGYITITDRLKDMIISGGENIGSMEVENTISTHPAVLECVVVAAPHEKWGETPAAQSLSEGALISYCKQKLGGFRAPSVVRFVDSLPKSGTGKVLKRELKEQFWQGYEKKVA